MRGAADVRPDGPHRPGGGGPPPGPERHPNFPDEPTGNQVYSEAQTELYRRLGKHVGDVLCRNLPLAEGETQRDRALSFDGLCARLSLSYLQECAAETAVADGEASAGGLLGPGANPAIAGDLEKLTADHFFPNVRASDAAGRRALAARLGASCDFPPAGEITAEQEADLWLRLYDRDADFRLYHDARVWHRLRGEESLADWEPTAGGEGGAAGRVLSPGHVAVAYMTCARRADADPPAGRDDRPRTRSDGLPFAAGGRARLTTLVSESFGPNGPLSPKSQNGFAELGRLRLRQFQQDADQTLNRMEQSPPHSREHFPTPGGVPAVDRFLIRLSEAAAPERGGKQITEDLAVWLRRELPPGPPAAVEPAPGSHEFARAG